MDFSEYKDQSKEILKEIGVDDESSNSEADFEDDGGPSKNTCVVIMESIEALWPTQMFSYLRR